MTCFQGRRHCLPIFLVVGVICQEFNGHFLVFMNLYINDYIHTHSVQDTFIDGLLYNVR